MHSGRHTFLVTVVQIVDLHRQLDFRDNPTSLGRLVEPCRIPVSTGAWRPSMRLGGVHLAGRDIVTPGNLRLRPA
jgi:hypothetical protein